MGDVINIILCYSYMRSSISCSSRFNEPARSSRFPLARSSVLVMSSHCRFSCIRLAVSFTEMERGINAVFKVLPSVAKLSYGYRDLKEVNKGHSYVRDLFSKVLINYNCLILFQCL